MRELGKQQTVVASVRPWPRSWLSWSWWRSLGRSWARWPPRWASWSTCC